MRPLKALGWTVAGIAALTALIWLGSLLYWHVRLSRMIGEWEREGKAVRYSNQRGYYGTSARVGDLLESAGCRTLPYLVSALDRTDGNPAFQAGLLNAAISILGGPAPYSDETYAWVEDRSRRWEFIPDGLELERREKLADFRAWWSQNGRKYHAWWRTWSKWCGDEATPDGRR